MTEDRNTSPALWPGGGRRTGAGGRATAFVCRNHVCRLPTTDPDQLSRVLTENRQQGESHDR